MKLVSIPYYILHLQYEMPASFIASHLRICRKNQKYLDPLIEMGLIEMTRPETPNSRLQQYVLTERGKELQG